jgi:hypothetical protein
MCITRHKKADGIVIPLTRRLHQWRPHKIGAQGM